MILLESTRITDINLYHIMLHVWPFLSLDICAKRETVAGKGCHQDDQEKGTATTFHTPLSACAVSCDKVALSHCVLYREVSARWRALAMQWMRMEVQQSGWKVMKPTRQLKLLAMNSDWQGYLHDTLSVTVNSSFDSHLIFALWFECICWTQLIGPGPSSSSFCVCLYKLDKMHQVSPLH